MVPTFTSFRSARSALSYTPAASPCLRRSPSAWPPRRRWHTASELTRTPHRPSHALHTGPDPPGSSRHFDYGASATDSLSLRPLALLAGPGPSGRTGPPRHCRGCSRPPRRSPAQAAPSFNQVAATTRRRRSSTSTRNNSRLVAHAIAKYTMTCGGSFPSDRFALRPAALTASSMTSRGTDEASTPSETWSVHRPPAATPAFCATSPDHPSHLPAPTVTPANKINSR